MRVPELMKKYILFALFVVSVFLFSSCATRGAAETVSPMEEEYTPVDWAGMVKFNKDSETKKCTVSVKSYIDGDTTHFLVPENVVEGGVLKARYLAVNTPESTGKIEEWGKAASRYTKEKLSSATSIIIESDDGNWNLDSTGSRYLVWVWYRSGEGENYRCLNLELLQEGLALPSSAANNRYGSWCQSAVMDAQKAKKLIWSGEKDPDFFYGEAVEITLKELRANIAAYDGMKVAFEGVVVANWNNSVYIEEWDEETRAAYGIPVYYGYSLSGSGLEILEVGNRVRIVGTVQYYAGGGTYQVSGIKYREMKKDDPGNIRLIEKGQSAVWRKTTPEEFNSLVISVIVDDNVKEMPFSYASLGTTVEMEDLHVSDVYTTVNEESSSRGAMTLHCTKDGETIVVRTVPLYKDGVLMDERDFNGRNITVRGVVDTYDGTPQIKVFRTNDITVL
ncbi:MAG: thermonuclease family protein [Candidatus Ornithospirochaeta sp.]